MLISQFHKMFLVAYYTENLVVVFLARLWPIYNYVTHFFDSLFAVEWICILYFKFSVRPQSSICYSVVCAKTNSPFLVPLLTLNFYVVTYLYYFVC